MRSRNFVIDSSLHQLVTVLLSFVLRDLFPELGKALQ